MKRLSFVLLIAASLILSGCAPAATAPIAPRAGAQPFAAVGAPMEAPAPTSAPAAEAPLSNDALQAAQAGGSTTGSDVAAGDTQRMVVQTAELTIVVQDVKVRVSQLEQMASSMGGNVVSENIGQTYAPDGTQVPDAQIVFRVPSGQLNTALDQVKKGAVDVQDETRTGVDITNQYVDLQSRLSRERGRRGSIDQDHAERHQDAGCVECLSTAGTSGQ